MKQPWHDTLPTGRLWATLLGVLLTCVALWFVLTGGHASSEGPVQSRRSIERGFPAATTPSDDTKLRGLQPPPPSRVAEAPSVDAVPVAAIRGSIADASTGDPIVGARVFLTSVNTDVVPAQACVTTGEDGAFLLDYPLSHGQDALELHALAAGYRPTTSPAPLPGAVLELLLDHGATIRGRVVDQLGKPVPEAEVYGAQPDNLDLWPASDTWIPVGAVGFRTSTGEDGTFVAQGLEEGMTYVLRARRRGYAPRPETQDVFSRPGEEQVTLELATCARLEVEALSPSGEPIPGVRIRAVYSSGTLPIGPIVVGSPTEDARATSERSLREWLLTTAEKTSREGADVSLRVTCSRLGYEPQSRTITMKATQRLRETMVMVRRPGTRWQRVRPTAQFEAGTPYHGALSLLVTEQGGAGEQMIVNAAFRKGHATREFELPYGLYEVVPFGVGSEGVFWKPAGSATAWSVDAATTATETSLCLSGGLLNLEVHDPRGRRIRALLIACTPRDSLGLQPVWILPGKPEMTASGGGLPSPGTPGGMWLPAGDQTLYVRRHRGKGVSIPLHVGSQGEIIQRVVTIPD